MRRSPWEAGLAAGIRSLRFGLLVSWLALTLGVWWVATNSFHTFHPERNPAAAKLFQPTSEAEWKGRQAAREVNSRVFRAWNRLQLVLGVCLLLLLWRTERAGGLPLALAVCLLLIVGAHVFWFSPRIEALGRALADAEVSSAPVESASAIQSEFGRYHGAYLATDALKACLLLGAIWRFRWRRDLPPEADARCG